MYALYGIVLGIIGLFLSRRIFGTVAAPLGIYSGAWAGLVALHFLVSAGNSGIYYELADRTVHLVFLAWGLWIVGCLLGSLGFSRSVRRPIAPLTDASSARLRFILTVMIGAAAIAPLLNLVTLYRTGALLDSGDAWRDTHFMRMREIYGQIGAIFDLSVPISLGAVYAGTIGGIYAVTRHGFPVRFAVLPMLLGMAYDVTAAGRFWLTQAPVLVVVSWLIFRRPPLKAGPGQRGPQPVRGNRVPPRPKQFTLSVRTVVIVAVLFGLSVGGLKVISQLRSALKTGSDVGVNVGSYRLHGALVSPVIYAASSLALFNYYAENGYDWDRLNGKVAIGGLIYLIGPVTRPLDLDWSKEILAYSDATNELRPVGPARSTLYFATYLLPAMSDFADLGIIIYPLLISFFVTRVFVRAYMGYGLLSMCLYPLCAVWIAISVMRWELMNSAHWAAMFWLLVFGYWMDRKHG